MHFNLVKLSFNGFAILFKILLAHCDCTQKIWPKSQHVLSYYRSGPYGGAKVRFKFKSLEFIFRSPEIYRYKYLHQEECTGISLT